MKVLVFGGCGIQGKAAVYDLSQRDRVRTTVVADLSPDRIRDLTYVNQPKTRLNKITVNDQAASVSLMNKGFDVVLDFLPPHFVKPVTEAAVRAGVHLVNTNSGYGKRGTGLKLRVSKT